MLERKPKQEPPTPNQIFMKTSSSGLRDRQGCLAPPADQFDHDRASEEESFIFAVIDFNPAGGGEGEPAPREDCHGLITAGEDVLVIQKVAVGFEIVGAAHADREPTAEGKTRTFDYREQATITPQLVGRNPVERALIDVDELDAVGVL